MQSIQGTSKENFLAFGGNSFVFKERESVRKYYNGGPFGSPTTGEQLSFYQKITNRASLKPWEINGLPHIRVNPVKEISWDEPNKCWTSVSPIVNGERVGKVYGKDRIVEIRKKLSLLNEKMNEALGVTGIEVSEGNIMVVDGDFVITDICTSTNALKEMRLQ